MTYLITMMTYNQNCSNYNCKLRIYLYANLLIRVQYYKILGHVYSLSNTYRTVHTNLFNNLYFKMFTVLV